MTVKFDITNEVPDFAEYGHRSNGILWDATLYGGPGPARLQQTPEWSREGGKSLRIEVRQGDGRFFNSGVPGSADSSHIPTEINTDQGLFNPGEEWFLRHSVMIPVGSKLGTGTFVTGLEMHGFGNYGAGLLYFRTNGDRWQVDVRGGDFQQWENHSFFFDQRGFLKHTQGPNGGGGAYAPPDDWQPSKQGQPIDFFTHWVLGTGNDGKLQVDADFHDGQGRREVVPATNLPTLCQNGGVPCKVYMSIGVYRPTLEPDPGILYIDGIRGATTAADLAFAGSPTPPPPPVPTPAPTPSPTPAPAQGFEQRLTVVEAQLAAVRLAAKSMGGAKTAFARKVYEALGGR